MIDRDLLQTLMRVPGVERAAVRDERGLRATDGVTERSLGSLPQLLRLGVNGLGASLGLGAVREARLHGQRHATLWLSDSERDAVLRVQSRNDVNGVVRTWQTLFGQGA
ncbi:MAG: hypothetical protein RBT55_04430 [Rhodocyclaceae bacterium]|nr:hypothetical protein [Rhodocyclaceae bacterium]